MTGNQLSLDLRLVLKKRQLEMEKAIEDYSGNDLVIYKDFNEGVILQEGDTVIAIDLIQNSTHTLDHSLIENIDAFFVTHEHWDHFDGYIARIATEMEKPYYTPSYMLSEFVNGVWDFHNPTMLAGAPGMNAGEIVTLNGWTIEAIETRHGNTQSHHVYLVTTPNGRKILHFGDSQSAFDAEIEIETYYYENGVLPVRMRNIDYLLAPVWWTTSRLEGFFTAFNAKVLIPTHSNEVGHAPDGRYSHDNLSGMAQIDKVQVLFYGESANSSELP